MWFKVALLNCPEVLPFHAASQLLLDSVVPAVQAMAPLSAPPAKTPFESWPDANDPTLRAFDTSNLRANSSSFWVCLERQERKLTMSK